MKRLILFLSLLPILQFCHAHPKKTRAKQIENAKAIFNPDGYYFPVDSLGSKKYQIPYMLPLGKHKLEYLGISLFEIQKYDYDNPIKISKGKSSVYLHFENFNLKSDDYLISRDTVRIVFNDSRIGKIKFIGRFLTARGPSQDATVESTKTIVLKCKVEDNQKPPYMISFVYWEGE